jgi:hypothetical protein
MLSRASIEGRFDRAVTRAGKAAQTFAHRKSTSPADVAWAVAFIADLNSFAARVRATDRHGLTAEELSRSAAPIPSENAANTAITDFANGCADRLNGSLMSGSERS